MIFKRSIIEILTISTILHAVVISQSYRSILPASLVGVYVENNIPFSDQIMQCISQNDSQKIVSFIHDCLIKEATGSSTQVILLIYDLHKFYGQLSSDLKECVTQSPELLKLSYKYRIGLNPLTEQQFTNYTKSSYLKLHKRFSQILYKQEDQQNYQQARFLFSQYGHQIFSKIKKYIKGVCLVNLASSALDSLQDIKIAIQTSSKAGINIIFVVVNNSPRRVYPYPHCYRYNIHTYSSVFQQQLSFIVNEKVRYVSGTVLNVGDYETNTTFLGK